MNSTIHLDEPHQLLECYGANPVPNGDGGWYCTHYGQITVKSLDLPQFKQGTLCFPWDMRIAYRELAITIDGKHCWLWRESFGPEILELAQAIATQDRQVINETEERLREGIPAAQTSVLVIEALNWLQSHNPTALEWFLFTELGWQVQAHVNAILQAVLRQDPALLQQALFDKTGETLTLEQWGPRPSYADPGDRVFARAVEIAIGQLLHRDPQLVHWFVANALNLPYEIQKQLLTEVRLFELLSRKDVSAKAEPAKARVRVTHKKGAQERSLKGIKQQVVATVKDGRVVDFQFESTGNSELDGAIRKDLERAKHKVKLPAKTKDGKVRVNITFAEKDSKQGKKLH